MVLKRSQTSRNLSMNISYEVATGHCISLPFETPTKANDKDSNVLARYSIDKSFNSKEKATSQVFTKLRKLLAEITFNVKVLLSQLDVTKTSRAMGVSAVGHMKG